MLRVTVLGSGSRGNAILVEGSRGAVVVDAGFGPRALARRFATAQRRPEDVSALLLTHEHVDHASGAMAACQKWGWTLHGVAASIDVLRASPEGVPERCIAFPIESPPAVAGFTVDCVPVPHDAAACVGYILTDQATGARVGVALDTGHVTDALPRALARCDLLVLESNHDEHMLANGPYPWPLKQRIAGKFGHLSNGASAGLLAEIAHAGLRGVVLAHLSQTNNTPQTALQRARDALRRAGWQRDVLLAAPQSVPTTTIDVARGALPASAQLSLGF